MTRRRYATSRWVTCAADSLIGRTRCEANDAAEDAAEAESERAGPADEMFERESMREWIRRRLDERAGDA